MVALSIPLRRGVGARQIALTALTIALAGLLAWYLLAIWFDLAPWLRGWKKYPDGWSWRFLETVPRWDRFITAGLGVAVVVGAAAWLIREPKRWRLALALGVMVIGAHVLEVGTLGLKLSSPHALLVQRVLDDDFTGYFQAAQTIQSPAEVFTDWRRLMKACGHCTSHPTGASAFYWPMIALAQALPDDLAGSLSSWLRDAFRLRVRNTDDASVVAAFLTGHLNLLLGALSVVPFFFLGRLISGTSAGGALTAALVATLPGLILMSPELDQVYALMAGAALLALLASVRSDRPMVQAGLGAACGLLVALGLFFTWGLLVWIPLLACMHAVFALGFHVFHHSHSIGLASRLRRVALSSVAALAGLAFPYVLLGWLTPYDVRDVARQGLAHYQTFEAIGRPGGAIWLFHGPLDTTQFIGLPLTLASLLVLFASAGRVWLPLGSRLTELLGRINVYTVALVGLIAVIFLGGYMKAESGRQLLFLMPLGALAVGAGVRAGSQTVLPWHWGLITAQTLVTLTIGARWITP